MRFGQPTAQAMLAIVGEETQELERNGQVPLGYAFHIVEDLSRIPFPSRFVEQDVIVPLAFMMAADMLYQRICGSNRTGIRGDNHDDFVAGKGKRQRPAVSSRCRVNQNHIHRPIDIGK